LAEAGTSGSSISAATGFISNASSFPPHVGQNVNFSAKPSSHAPQYFTIFAIFQLPRKLSGVQPDLIRFEHYTFFRMSAAGSASTINVSPDSPTYLIIDA